ncbi:galactosyltransferase-related protein [Geminocystis sp. NIES-3708]|uniref:glycosyltransferase family 2 protein n=1 Tax=Geminocystis sp. NIES-3708 TaxID=1615909 RepID=UPI000831ED4D|nr:galactosyltransferase-related protein [Geminocystis sp. NIES-3708]
MRNQLTLLIPYRRRELAFNSFYNWLKWTKKQNNYFSSMEIILIENDLSPTLTIKQQALDLKIKYYFIEGDGIFHKTYLLNSALKLVETKYLMAYDIDLIPYKNSLFKHWQLTAKSNDFLVTGYRLMLEESYLYKFDLLEDNIKGAKIAPEDQPTALKKHLISFEKMGVLPIFETEKIIKIGGWDENFIGWGGEDQDLIQRYCFADNLSICKVPELLYLHLAHDYQLDWYSSEIITQNRNYYYQKYYHESD